MSALINKSRPATISVCSGNALSLRNKCYTLNYQVYLNILWSFSVVCTVFLFQCYKILFVLKKNLQFWLMLSVGNC